MKQEWKDTALGGAAILFGVAKAGAEAFGPLKAVLCSLSVIYENFEVRSQPPAQNTFLMNPSVGHSRSQEEDPRPLLTHSCIGDDLRSACG